MAMWRVGRIGIVATSRVLRHVSMHRRYLLSATVYTIAAHGQVLAALARGRSEPMGARSSRSLWFNGWIVRFVPWLNGEGARVADTHEEDLVKALGIGRRQQLLARGEERDIGHTGTTRTLAVALQAGAKI
jgi:hypothetical protein